MTPFSWAEREDVMPGTGFVEANDHFLGLSAAVDEKSEVDAPGADGPEIESVHSAIGFEVEFDASRSHAQAITEFETTRIDVGDRSIGDPNAPAEPVPLRVRRRAHVPAVSVVVVPDPQGFRMPRLEPTGRAASNSTRMLDRSIARLGRRRENRLRRRRCRRSDRDRRWRRRRI
jgi:hypothetical protein